MSERRPPVKMERRDVRITVRYTESEAERLATNARRRGDEVSRHIRKASLMGDTLLEHLPDVQATGA